MRKNFTPMLILKIVLLFATATLFSSCKDLLDASSLKDEIEKKVEYINSQDVEILVISKQGSVTPNQKLTKKATDRIKLYFSAYPDFQFIKWAIIDPKTGKPFENMAESNSIGTFENCASSETTFTLNKAIDSTVTITPICAERPQVLTRFPVYKPAGVYRDSRIEIMFDHDINSSSTYYDKENYEAEIRASDDRLIRKSGFAPRYIPTYLESEGNHYGYRLEIKLLDAIIDTVFKNIEIRDINNKNLLEHFAAPFWEDNSTLIIPAKKTLPIGTQLIVSIENFFYNYPYIDDYGNEQQAKVFMAEPAKWNYVVNNDVDTEAPTVFPVYISNKSPITSVPNTIIEPDPNNLSTTPHLKDGKLYILAKVEDKKSGPANTFSVTCNKYDSTLTTTTEVNRKTLNYTNKISSTIYACGTAEKPQAIDFSDLDDGFYQAVFSFSDNSGNTFGIYVDPTTYDRIPILLPTAAFRLDTSGPENTVTFENNSSTNTLTASWTPTWDYSSSKWSYNNTTASATVSGTSIKTATLSNSSSYSQISLKQYDDVENERIFTYEKPTLKTFTVKQNSSSPTKKIDVSWEYPDSTENLTGVEIYYGTTNNYKNATLINTTLVSSGTTKYELSNLTPGTKYYVWLVPYYRFATTDKTKGNALSKNILEPVSCYAKTSPVTNLTGSSRLGSVTLSWTKPEGNVVGYKISYYKTPAKSELLSRPIAIIDTASTSYLIQNLNLSTSYDFVVTAYSDDDNISSGSQITIKTPTLTKL